MKKIISIILSITLVCCAFSFSGCFLFNSQINNVSGDDLVGKTRYVKWEGRYEYNESEKRLYQYHTATGFTVDFVGTTLSVTFYIKSSKDIYYNFALDDETLPQASEDRTFFVPKNSEGTSVTITLVDKLENGAHKIKCLKMSEPYDGTVAIEKIETDGRFIVRNSEDDNANFKFMFVCGSGGSGHGSLSYSTVSDKARTTANSSSLHAFNYLTARQFDADVQFVANSGWGVKFPKSIYEVFDYSGITSSNSVSGAKTTALWDHSSWVPDVIIFNIGGNDTTAIGFVEKTYKETVVALVEKLHALYPNAKMIWTHTVSNAGKYAISALTDAGIMRDGYIKEVTIPKVAAGETGTGTYGANNHNSIKTHIDTAKILAEALNTNWGYRPIYNNITFSDFQSVLQTYN